MRPYLELYFRLIASRIRAQMQYRFSFVMDVAANLFSNVTDLAALFVMFTQATALGGWSLGEVAFLLVTGAAVAFLAYLSTFSLLGYLR